jgi:hypothetical protein
MQLNSLPACTKCDICLRNIGRCTVLIHVYCHMFQSHVAVILEKKKALTFSCWLVSVRSCRNMRAQKNEVPVLIFRGPLMVAQWLRYCATNRKVTGSIPDGVYVIGIFH